MDSGVTLKYVKPIMLSVVAVAALAAAVAYVIPAARHRSQNVAQGKHWMDLLRRHAAFSSRPPAYPIDVRFSYASPTDANLVLLRDRYHLEGIAGQGSETDRIINLMRWVYRLTGHANEPVIPEARNALNLIPLATEKHMMINCYLKTVILNEVYLAMGFASRQTHLLPYENEEEESHFITSVFSRTCGRWLLMDPDFGVYVVDGRGAILGVAGIRRRLIAGRTLVVKTVDGPQGGLAPAWARVRAFVSGTSYLWYLGKNIFKMDCAQESRFNQAAAPKRIYFELVPDGYREELLLAPQVTPRGHLVIDLNDENLFWQRPSADDSVTASAAAPSK